MSRVIDTLINKPPHMAEQVRKAMPIARRLVARGIGDLGGGIVCDDDHVPGYVSALVGHNGPEYTREDWTKQEEWTAGAYALGIAVGLLLRASAFDDED
jgi:hypothetical protein